MADMEKDKEKLREQLNDVSSALEYHQQHSVEKHKFLLAEQKIRDLETKLELEISQKLRLEVTWPKYNMSFLHLKVRNLICSIRFFYMMLSCLMTESLACLHLIYQFQFAIRCVHYLPFFITMAQNV